MFAYAIAAGLTERGIKNVMVVDESAFPESIGKGFLQVMYERDGASRVLATAMADYILQDVQENPLKDGEKVHLVGYSGGGTVAIEAARLLDGKVAVDQIVTLGTPAGMPVSNASKVHMAWSPSDGIQMGTTLYPPIAVERIRELFSLGYNVEMFTKVGHYDWAYSAKVLDWAADLLR